MGIVAVSGGRQVAYEVWGDPAGAPVFLLHGTPGSRLGIRAPDDALASSGARLITYDRPGYGQSDPYPERTVADCTTDVAAVADALGHREFAVVGFSGGGPHALACAALLPDRVVAASSMVGVAPYPADGLDWFAGMTESNIEEFGAAIAGRNGLLALLAPVADAIRADPAAVLASLETELSDADRQAMANPAVRAMLLESFAESVRAGVTGWIDDDLAFCHPWGFEPADIAVPTLLWHGDNDLLVPPAHTRWLANRIPQATLVTREDAGHMDAIAALPEAIDWLVAPTRRIPGP